MYDQHAEQPNLNVDLYHADSVCIYMPSVSHTLKRELSHQNPYIAAVSVSYIHIVMLYTPEVRTPLAFV